VWRRLIIIVSTIAYLILLIALLASPRKSTAPAVGVEVWARVAGASIAATQRTDRTSAHSCTYR
jgi:anti-sigma-K factor RskA